MVDIEEILSSSVIDIYLLNYYIDETNVLNPFKMYYKNI